MMNDIDGWIDFDGPEPESIRPLLDALRELPPSTPEDKQRMARRLSEKLDAEFARKGEPSVATAATSARAPGDAREPRPPEGRPVEDLTTTALVLEIPAEVREQMGRLPFKPRAPGTELTRTMQVPVLNPRQGETAPLGDDSIAKAVAALPFAGNTVGAALVSYPRLSLEAYASLRAELSLGPERSAEILPRYHMMNEAARRALDEHWQIELAASPEARATFDKLLADFMPGCARGGDSCEGWNAPSFSPDLGTPPARSALPCAPPRPAPRPARGLRPRMGRSHPKSPKSQQANLPTSLGPNFDEEPFFCDDRKLRSRR